LDAIGAGSGSMAAGENSAIGQSAAVRALLLARTLGAGRSTAFWALFYWFLARYAEVGPLLLSSCTLSPSQLIAVLVTVTGNQMPTQISHNGPQDRYSGYYPRKSFQTGAITVCMQLE